MKSNLILSFASLILAILIASFFKVTVSDAFANTIYTISGIMFSIGMGIACTFNPERIKNNEYLAIIRKNIRKIRSSFIYFFSLTSAIYLISHALPSSQKLIASPKISLAIDIPILFVIINIVGIIYYINNFLAIQQLNFDITDRINSEKL